MRYEFQSTQVRQDILSDLPKFVKCVRIVGSATRYNNEDHLVLRLRVLPIIKFFLKENDDDSEQFTIFSGKNHDVSSVRFYHPVGFGEKISDEFIKLKFYDLDLICYLQLKPFDQSLISPAA